MRSRYPGRAALHHVAPFLHRVDHPRQETAQSRGPPECLQNALVGVLGERNLLVVVGLAEAIERDAEGRASRPDAVEEVDGKVAADASVRKPGLAWHPLFGVTAVRAIAQVEGNGREQDRKAQAHAHRDDDGEVARERQPAIAGRALDRVRCLLHVLDDPSGEELAKIFFAPHEAVVFERETVGARLCEAGGHDLEHDLRVRFVRAVQIPERQGTCVRIVFEVRGPGERVEEIRQPLAQGGGAPRLCSAVAQPEEVFRDVPREREENPHGDRRRDPDDEQQRHRQPEPVAGSRQRADDGERHGGECAREHRLRVADQNGGHGSRRAVALVLLGIDRREQRVEQRLQLLRRLKQRLELLGDLVGNAGELVEAALRPSLFGGRGSSRRNRTRRSPADALEAVLLRELTDRGRVHDAARNPALHHQITKGLIPRARSHLDGSPKVEGWFDRQSLL